MALELPKRNEASQQSIGSKMAVKKSVFNAVDSSDFSAFSSQGMLQEARASLAKTLVG